MKTNQFKPRSILLDFMGGSFLHALLIVIMCSCNAEFNSLEQAKNEFNRQGVRDGKWAVFYDSLNTIVNQSDKYYKYMLIEFSNGTWINDAKIYTIDGQLVQSMSPFEDLPQVIEDISPLKMNFETRRTFDKAGTNILTEVFDSKMNLVEVTKYTTDNDNKVLTTESITNSYLEKQITKTSINQYQEGEVKNKIIVELGEESILNQTSNNSELQRSLEQFFFETIQNDSLLVNYCFKEDDKANFPFRIKKIIFNDAEILLGEKLANELKNQKDLISQNESNRQRVKNNNNQRNSSNSSGSCYYCARTFSKADGFIKGLGLDCFSTVRSAFSTIEIGERMGHPGVGMLMDAYRNGYLFCSRRCAQQEGYAECGY